MNSATSFDDDNNPFSVKIIVSNLNNQISIQNGWKNRKVLLGAATSASNPLMTKLSQLMMSFCDF